jgi:hypothetical protein
MVNALSVFCWSQKEIINFSTINLSAVYIKPHLYGIGQRIAALAQMLSALAKLNYHTFCSARHVCCKSAALEDLGLFHTLAWQLY